MRTLIDGLVRKQGLHVARQREEFEGYELYLVPFMPGVQAAYAVTDEVLVVSTAPSLVKDVLRRLGEDGPASLADDPGLKAWSEDLERPHTVLAWSPAADQYRAMLALLTPEGIMRVAAMAGSLGADLGPDDMQAVSDAVSPWLGDCETPDPSVVDDYVDGPDLTLITVSDGVLRLRTLSP
jgi:hypothetical protein